MTKTRERASQIRRRLNQIPGEVTEQVKRMVGVRRMMRGYLYHSRRRCGKPSCRCAQGQLHEAWILATKVKGKPTTRSVSRGLRKKAQELVGQYRQFREAQRGVRKLLQEVVGLSRELEGLLSEDFFKEEG